MSVPAPFPFIVGSPRSGTTLLRAMLDTHEDLSIPPEAQFLVPMLRSHRRYEHGGFDVERFLHDLRARPEFRRWRLPREEVAAAVAEAAPGGLAVVFRSLYELYARERGATRYGDKTPGNVMVMPALLEWFPEARFVHLIRDGRDVAASLAGMEWFTGGLGSAALRWKRSVQAGRANAARLGPERYLEVRYEDLVAEPQATLATVSSFLSLGFDPAMAHYEGGFAIVEQRRQAQHHQHLEMPLTQGIRDWRRDLSAGDLARIEASIGDLLDAMGYGRASSGLPLGIRWRARMGSWVEGVRLAARRARTSEVVG